MEKFHFLVWVFHKGGSVNNTETFCSQKYWVLPLCLFLRKRMRLNRRQGSKHSAYLQTTSETENNSKSKEKGLFLLFFQEWAEHSRLYLLATEHFMQSERFENFCFIRLSRDNFRHAFSMFSKRQVVIENEGLLWMAMWNLLHQNFWHLNLKLS